MNYLIFSNEILLSDGNDVHRLDKGDDFQNILGSIQEVKICVVDVDVELASAPESRIDRKDSILARKFGKLHPNNEYILQDEKIDDNIFQIMGIKADKIKEIYSLIPSDKVKVCIPYAMAVRHFLLRNNIELEKGVIFIDELGNEKLATVFSGLKFSVTRTLSKGDIGEILPEIKRSEIGFSKKIEEFDSWKKDHLSVVTNSPGVASYITKIDQSIKVELINLKYPSIAGLKEIENIENIVKFLLPEDIKRKKRKQELKEKAISLILSVLILGSSSGFVLINKIKLSLGQREYVRLNQQNKILESKLTALDLKTYREDLKQQKFINYATAYLEILNILPQSYEIDTFKYYQTDHWKLEAYIFSKDNEAFDEIPKVNILKNAVINDYFIKDKPGKRIQVDL